LIGNNDLKIQIANGAFVSPFSREWQLDDFNAVSLIAGA
jgi:hypothetical protein